MASTDDCRLAKVRAGYTILWWCTCTKGPNNCMIGARESDSLTSSQYSTKPQVTRPRNNGVDTGCVRRCPPGTDMTVLGTPSLIDTWRVARHKQYGNHNGEWPN
ncbi:hypothetical protein J6590_005860 [Homalodisca vitripennis]|nr:hypothetical protein J6590_005860 [Homalodisca vitripennis]